MRGFATPPSFFGLVFKPNWGLHITVGTTPTPPFVADVISPVNRTLECTITELLQTSRSVKSVCACILSFQYAAIPWLLWPNTMP